MHAAGAAVVLAIENPGSAMFPECEDLLRVRSNTEVHEATDRSVSFG